MVLLVASLSWAAGSFQANGHHASWPARRAGMHLLAGGALLGLASIATGEAGAVDPSGMTPRSLLALGYLVLFGTLVGYSAFVWLLGRTDPSRVASHAYVNPVVAVTLGVVIAREPITVATVLGAILIVFAVAMIVASQAKGRESTRVAAAAPAAASKPDRRRSGRRGGVRGVEVRTECRT
jgi:drug/metabolite transporter (DMT)-like permease